MHSTAAHVISRSRRATAALSAAALVFAGLVLGTPPVAQGVVPATAAPAPAAAADVPPTYERALTAQLDSSRSYATVRHLVEEIGPRLNGTPAERRAAAYLRDVLEPYGYEVALESWGPVSTKRTADIVTAGAPLPGGPKWQMAASPLGVFTGDGAPVTADVVSVGTGQNAADYADAAGRIAFATVADSAERATAMDVAAANGAVSVILAPPVPATGKVSPRNPTFPQGTQAVSIPVLGAGSDHTVWLNQALTAGPVSLRLVTNEYVDPMGTNIIATRHAVGDPQGTTAPIVMVGAHIDSVLGAPGGHDDASGNGVSTEIARVLATLPYDKEIRIGGFGGEEGGLLGARAYVDTLTPAERDRFVGEWQMDMVGTTYEPARLWALTPDGKTNFVVDEAYAAAQRDGFEGLRNCKLGQSDHQAFFDAGIPAALFIWLDYREPVSPATCESIRRGSYQTEPEYHQPSDGMNNVSQERLQITLDVVGGAVIENALNALDITAVTDRGVPLDDAQVLVDCGDGDHDAGRTDATGQTTTRVPAGRCTVSTSSGPSIVSQNVVMSGDESVTLTLDTTAPVIDLVRPVDGATYQVGSTVTALYFCTDAAGTTCTGTRRSGVDLDTSAPGTRTFTVEARDPHGNVATKTVSYRVEGTTTVTLSAEADDTRYGQSPVVRIDLGPSELPGTGSVEVRDGTRVLATAPGQPGIRRVLLPTVRPRPGIHGLDVVYLDATGAEQATAAINLVVRRANSRLRVRPVRVHREERGRMPVRLALRPRDIRSAARGMVVVRSRGHVLGQGRLRKGHVVIRLDRIQRPGRSVLKVRYRGNGLVRPARTSTELIVIRR